MSEQRQHEPNPVPRRRLLINAGTGVGLMAGVGLLGCTRSDEDTGTAGSPLRSRTSSTSASTSRSAASSTDITIRWLGTNAWEIQGGGATVLVDPWVTRFRTGAPKGEKWDMDTPLTIDEAAVDEHIGEADCVLITHGHWDHITDIPYVASRTGATVLGTETHLNLLRAMDTPDEQLGQVSGGELYSFDGFTVEVFDAHHNVSGRHKRLLFAGTIPGAVPKRPETVRDLVEGGSLAYLLTMGGTKLLIGVTTNFQEREVEELRPTVLFMQTGNRNSPGYEERLLAAAGYPPYVVPTHWDDYEEPLNEPAVDWLGARELSETVSRLSPESEFILLDHLESFTVGG